jgi:DNA-binding LytR/AlgR family response regulator
MVENGLKAVESVKTGNFDVVFLDIRMTEMNGVEASKEIKKFNKKNHYYYNDSICSYRFD